MRILSLLTVLGLVLIAGCKKQAPPSDPMAAREPLPEPPPKGPAEAPPPATASLQRVFYEYDSASLTDPARSTLTQNAEIMASRSGLRIEVQGHCDERGSTEYNLALGQRRADSARQALQSQGVAGSRLTTVSFGEERPLATGEGEGAWSTNRRAEFRVLDGGDSNIVGSTP